jgi:hypothetical protein
VKRANVLKGQHRGDDTLDLRLELHDLNEELVDLEEELADAKAIQGNFSFKNLKRFADLQVAL